MIVQRSGGSAPPLMMLILLLLIILGLADACTSSQDCANGGRCNTAHAVCICSHDYVGATCSDTAGSASRASWGWFAVMIICTDVFVIFAGVWILYRSLLPSLRDVRSAVTSTTKASPLSLSSWVTLEQQVISTALLVPGGMARIAYLCFDPFRARDLNSLILDRWWNTATLVLGVLPWIHAANVMLMSSVRTMRDVLRMQRVIHGNIINGYVCGALASLSPLLFQLGVVDFTDSMRVRNAPLMLMCLPLIGLLLHGSTATVGAIDGMSVSSPRLGRKRRQMVFLRCFIGVCGVIWLTFCVLVTATRITQTNLAVWVIWHVFIWLIPGLIAPVFLYFWLVDVRSRNAIVGIAPKHQRATAASLHAVAFGAAQQANRHAAFSGIRTL